jgi:hypothetical protein
MDNNEITDGLRGLVLAEPPLGFAPDEVANRAARRQRDRRVAIGTGVAVTTVAVAAVAFAVNVTSTGGGAAGAGPTESRPAGSSTAQRPAHDLTAQSTRNRQHLRQVLGGVLPDATEIKVADFDQNYPEAADAWTMLTTEVTFRDDAGPAYFTLTVAGPQAAGDFEPLASRCDPHPVDDNGKPLEVPTLPNGQPLRCKKLPQPDGSTVVVEETGEAAPGKGGDLEVVRVAGLDAMHYRTDGSTVNIVNDDLVSVRTAEEYGEKNRAGTRPRIPLTEQQLIALVTDPAFNLG